MSEPTAAQRLEGERERKNRRIACLRARVAELEAAIRTVLSDHEPIWNGYHSWCQICSPADSSWPCLVRLELDAVLPPGEEQG